MQLSTINLALTRIFGGSGYGAALNLDFTSGNETLDPRITFTRASSGTRINRLGVIESITTNNPRFDYDPVTLRPKGLLIEEQRTNELLNSLIDGTNLSTQNITTTAVTRTLSFYGTGTITLSGTHSATVVGTGAYPTRTTYTYTPTAGTLTVTVSGSVKFANNEIGSFATSFIPTAGTQVTRSADIATMTGTNFSSWYNQSEGTLFAEADTSGWIVNTHFPLLVGIDDGTTANRVTVGQGSSSVGLNGVVRSSSVSSSIGNSGKNLSSTSAAVAVAFSGATLSASAGGLTAVNGTSNGLPAGLTTLRIGFSSLYLNALNGHIKRIAYWSRRLANTELQSLSS